MKHALCMRRAELQSIKVNVTSSLPVIALNTLLGEQRDVYRKRSTGK